MKNLFKISLICLPIFASAGTIENTKISNDPVVKEVEKSDSISVIKDLVGQALKKKFGYEFKIDPGMENGCYNYLDSYLTKRDKPFVNGQAHLHDVFIMNSDVSSFSPEYFANGIIETVEEPAFERSFQLFEPTRYWVTTKKIGEKYYLIISLD